MSILLTNAILLDLDPIEVEIGGLRMHGNRITERGSLRAGADEEVLDCRGAVVMPGLVNGHTHLYSALAVGMPPPSTAPGNFLDILRLIWWRLDRALDRESIEISAQIGALQALRCGTTTLIDHHASPNCINGSLDSVERGVDAVGLRAVLCYETTDRHGRSGRDQGLEENRRYLRKCSSRRSGKFAAMVGAHASFTLQNDSLDALVNLAEEFAIGVHIHVAEDPCDELACRREHGVSLIDRLDAHGLLRPQHIFAHGTHLDDQAIARVNQACVLLAHNPRSNMNNSVGYSPISKLQCPVMLGTDGNGSDMFAEAQIAWLKSRDARAGIAPEQFIAMLAASARRASASLGVTLGTMAVGAAADVVVTDYIPNTPLTTHNAAAHLVYALGARHVRHAFVDGQCVMRNREIRTCDEPATCQQSDRVAAQLWHRIESIAP